MFDTTHLRNACLLIGDLGGGMCSARDGWMGFMAFKGRSICRQQVGWSLVDNRLVFVIANRALYQEQQ